MSNAGPGEKRMHVGKMHAGEVWTDVLGWEKDEVVIGHDGFGTFICPGTSLSVWVKLLIRMPRVGIGLASCKC